MLVYMYMYISQNSDFVIVLQVHTILDEIILGGQVLETNSSEVVRAVEEISK